MFAAVKQSHKGPQSSLQPGSVESSPSVPPNSQQLAEVTGQLERLHGMLLRNYLFGMNDLLQERYFVSDITSHVFSARKYNIKHCTSLPTPPGPQTTAVPGSVDTSPPVPPGSQQNAGVSSNTIPPGIP